MLNTRPEASPLLMIHFTIVFWRPVQMFFIFYDSVLLINLILTFALCRAQPSWNRPLHIGRITTFQHFWKKKPAGNVNSISIYKAIHRVIAALKHWDMGENPITFIDFDNFFFKIKMNSEMVWKKPLSLLRVV